MDEVTPGTLLERSLAIDKPKALRPVKVFDRVVSEPQKPVKQKVPVEAEEYKPTPRKAEKRFTIEALPSDGKPRESEDVVNTRSLQHLMLLKHFGIEEKPSPEDIQKLKAIWEFNLSDSYSETLSSIIRLKNKLGVPRIGETLLDKVYRYVQLRKIQAYEKV